MKILPAWLREFVEIPVDDRRLGDDLTNAGISVEAVYGEGAEAAFDVDFTPNRVDAMNHYGVARECSAIYDRELKPLTSVILREAAGRNSSAAESKDPKRAAGASSAEAAGRPASFPIEIEAPELCARYTARVIRGVKIAPSPAAIARRLELLDSRAISNVADASNYTLQEMGHPTHCFDLDRLEGGKIVVRRARPGETLKTLDGVERKLDPDDLVIADAKKPVALAGVMGGYDSMITERTRNVLVESAWFQPASIRRTARRHGMHTDASHRFERGADLEATPLACARVAALILQTAGGSLEGGQIDAFPRPRLRPSLQLRGGEVRRILGQEIPLEEIARILRRLGFAVESVPTGRSSRAGVGAALAEAVADLAVTVPSWRLDVEREIDLIEEVARIYGFDRFANTLPGFVGSVVELPHERQQEKLRSRLLALGYSEAVSLTFISRQDAAEFASLQPVAIANPISEEASVLRTSMAPGMLGMLAYNLARGNADVRLFETGHIYEALGEKTAEHRRACLGAAGSASPAGVHGSARPYTFFDLKGDMEALLASYEHQALYFDAHAADYYHPGRSARAVMDGVTVAQFGQVHPRIAAERKLRLSAQKLEEVYLAEIDLERLYLHPLRQPRYREISRYPAVERDFSFIFADSVTFERIQATVASLKLEALRSLAPAEIFRGGSIAAGKYSLLLRATFQSPDRTLRDEEVAQWSGQIIQALGSIGGVLRSQ